MIGSCESGLRQLTMQQAITEQRALNLGNVITADNRRYRKYAPFLRLFRYGQAACSTPDGAGRYNSSDRHTRRRPEYNHGALVPLRVRRVWMVGRRITDVVFVIETPAFIQTTIDQQKLVNDWRNRDDREYSSNYSDSPQCLMHNASTSDNRR
jgi:hypothetical protein